MTETDVIVSGIGVTIGIQIHFNKPSMHETEWIVRYLYSIPEVVAGCAEDKIKIPLGLSKKEIEQRISELHPAYRSNELIQVYKMNSYERRTNNTSNH